MVKDKIEYNKQKTMTYQEYRDLVAKLVDEHSTTGNDTSETMVELYDA